MNVTQHNVTIVLSSTEYPLTSYESIIIPSDSEPWPQFFVVDHVLTNAERDCYFRRQLAGYSFFFSSVLPRQSRLHCEYTLDQSIFVDVIFVCPRRELGFRPFSLRSMTRSPFLRPFRVNISIGGLWVHDWSAALSGAKYRTVLSDSQASIPNCWQAILVHWAQTMITDWCQVRFPESLSITLVDNYCWQTMSDYVEEYNGNDFSW